MRLFVAVEIDDRARRVARGAQEKLQRALNSTLKARWVPSENLHLTVRFIGHVQDARVSALIEALAPPLDIPPFDVQLGGWGVFPRTGPPRAVWVGLTQGLSELASIHDALNQRLQPLGFEPEGRAFSAHLTIARIKHAPKGAGRTVHAALDRITIPATRVAVSRATVFESHLSPKGPRYEPMAFIPLYGEL
jgi:RNA 2',3'-cyclic 3'-phosphodiesterase